MALNQVSTTGPVLAALLASLAKFSDDVDGLILGTTRTRTKQTLQDNIEATSVEVSEAFITALPCLGTSFSFYSPSGAVDEAQLRSLASAFSDPVLGFYVYRPDTALTLSMREQVLVPRALQSLRSFSPNGVGNPSDASLLFGILSSGRDHGGATSSIQYRFFQQSVTSALQPVRIRLANVGTSAAHRAYAAATPPSGLPPVPCPVEFSPDIRRSSLSEQEGEPPAGSTRATSAPSRSAAAPQEDSDLTAAAHDVTSGLQQQVDRIDQLYWRLIRQVEVVEPDLGKQLASVQEQRRRVEQLYLDLGL